MRSFISLLLLLGASLMAGAETRVYSYADENVGMWGTGKPETYDVAMRISDPTLAGKKIVAVQAYLATAEGINSPSIWLSKELKLVKKINTPDIMSQEVELTEATYANLACAGMGIELTEPYEITADGVYVGFSFTTTMQKKDESEESEESTDPAATPLLLSRTAYPDGFYFHSQRTQLKWKDYTGTVSASALIFVTLEGEFPTNDLGLASIVDAFAHPNETCDLTAIVSNRGASPITSLSYVYTVDGGDASSEKSITLEEGVEPNMVHTSKAKLPIDGIATVGEHTVTLTITKLNGNDNESATPTATGSVIILDGDLPVHRAVVEEFTGCWCGFCTRGWLALELMNELYPDDFIGLAYHNGDPMQIMTNYPVTISGYPSASIERGAIIDPFYGTEKYSTELPIANDWLDACAVPVPIAISGEASWADTDATSIIVDATLTFAKTLTDIDYRLSYILVANDLHSTDATWNQTNYYNGAGYSGYMSQICAMPSSINDLHYNDVVVISKDIKGIVGSLPTEVAFGEAVGHSYQFQLADAVSTYDTFDGSNLIQDKNKLKVVVLVIDGSTGKVLNAVKIDVPDAPITSGIATVADGKAQEVSSHYYDLQGRPVAAPAKGLYIKMTTLSDGTVSSSKELVR